MIYDFKYKYERLEKEKASPSVTFDHGREIIVAEGKIKDLDWETPGPTFTSIKPSQPFYAIDSEFKFEADIDSDDDLFSPHFEDKKPRVSLEPLHPKEFVTSSKPKVSFKYKSLGKGTDYISNMKINKKNLLKLRRGERGSDLAT